MRHCRCVQSDFIEQHLFQSSVILNIMDITQSIMTNLYQSKHFMCKKKCQNCFDFFATKFKLRVDCDDFLITDYFRGILVLVLRPEAQ